MKNCGMEVDTTLNLREDRAADCRSLGSFHHSSLSRKISIGIMVDLLSTNRTGTLKDDAVVANADVAISNKDNYNRRKKKEFDVNADKQVEVLENVNSPWITPKSSRRRLPTLGTTLEAKGKAKLPTTRKGSKRVKDIPVTIKFFKNEDSPLQSGDENQMKFSGITYRRKVTRDGNSQRMEDFAFATAQDKLEKKEKTQGRQTEALRMKLGEIVGTVSSPKSHSANSQVCEVEIAGLMPDWASQTINLKSEELIKLGQSSDTIESDSESPCYRMAKPITRSVMRKRASARVKDTKTKAVLHPVDRNKLQKKRILSFIQGWEGKGNGPSSSGLSMPRKQKAQKKIETQHFNNKNNNMDYVQGANLVTEASPPAIRTALLGNKTGNRLCCTSQAKGEKNEMNNGDQERNLHHTPGGKSDLSHRTRGIDKLNNFNSPAVPEIENQHGDVGSPSPRNVLEQEVFPSPTLRINSRIYSRPPSTSPGLEEKNELDHSDTQADRRADVGNVRCLKNPEISKADNHVVTLNAQTESSHSVQELKHSCVFGESPSKLKRGTEDSLHQSKRQRRNEAERISNSSLVTPSAQELLAASKTDWMLETSEQNDEDELQRAVMRLASALGKFQKKIKLSLERKSFQIQKLVSDEIHQKLRNFESEIQTDLAKLKSFIKSKGQGIETRLQEQQDRLTLMHDKFKQDIQWQLEECTSILEGIQVHQQELIGTWKNQRENYQRLVILAEEAVERQLADAERRMMEVEKLEKRKMLQFKHLIADFLKEGILS